MMEEPQNNVNVSVVNFIKIKKTVKSDQRMKAYP